MRFKDKSIKLASLRPQTVVGMIVCDGVYADEGVECVCTSVNDGRHSYGSLHKSGQAFDLRSRTLADPYATVEEIKRRMPGDFDVIYELDPPHIHVEWQPK